MKYPKIDFSLARLYFVSFDLAAAAQTWNLSKAVRFPKFSILPEANFFEQVPFATNTLSVAAL